MKAFLPTLALFLGAGVAHAQTPEGFDAKLVAAWKGVDAKIGWFQEGKLAWHLFHEKKPDFPSLPAIHWPGGKPFEFGLLASLPAPAVPFAFDFHNTTAGATELRDLRGFKNLVALNLDGVPLIDADFKEIGPLKGLKTLYVRDAKVSDAGVKELAGLTHLHTIDLSCCAKVTDDSLKHFADMRDLDPNLRVLCLPKETTSDEAVAQFQKSYPSVTVHR